MRAWRTADGALLVEWRIERAILLPDGREVSTASFLRLEGEAVTREFPWSQSSLEDWLYTTAHFVEGAHFFIQSQQPRFIELLSAELRRTPESAGS